ncbi:MAG: type III polyketide synthase [Planctomycetota bacterium]|nr:MAG: type III polyketide synthase [Planctomycetota bacterium]
MANSKACYIHDITTATPGLALHRDDALTLLGPAFQNARTARLARRLIRLTEIEKRYLAVLEHQVGTVGRSPLYLPAEEQPNGPTMGARNRLFAEESAKLVRQVLDGLSHASLKKIDVLVTCSCTHASSPGLEHTILTGSPVPATCSRWNLGFMGCSAALAGLRLAHGLAASNPRALIVACELSSLHFQYSDQLDQLTANLLFSDGAAAVHVSPEPSAVRIVDCRCVTAPQHADQMVWFADDFGLRLHLSQELPATLAALLPQAVREMLSDHELESRHVDHWLVHPGGPQILDSVENCLGLGAGRLDLSRSVLRRYGNMSSPTICFILKEHIERRLDGWCVALAFGPGLTIELALLDIRRQ